LRDIFSKYLLSKTKKMGQKKFSEIDLENWVKNKLVSLSFAARQYGCTPEHLNLLCRKKKLEGKKIGRNWFTKREWTSKYFGNEIDDDKWDDNQLVTLSYAARQMGYTPEYLNMLCRNGSINAKKIGRNWFTTKEWANEYFKKNVGATRKEKGVWVNVIQEEEKKIDGTPLIERLKIEDGEGGENIKQESELSAGEEIEKSEEILDKRSLRKKTFFTPTYFHTFLGVSTFVVAIIIGNFYLQFLNRSQDLEKIYGPKIYDQEGFVKGETTTEAPGTNVAFASENFQASEINIGGDVDIKDNDENTPLKMYELDSEGFTTKDKKEYRMLVKWKTNKMTKSEIEYAKQNSQDTTTLTEEDYGFDHVAVISKLDFSNAYIYTIRSRDKWGNEIESDAFGFYTGSKEVSVFELILQALNDTFGWAVKK
jgi:hypothetical protein